MGATGERRQVNLIAQKVEDKAQDTSHPSPTTPLAEWEGQAQGKWREIANHVVWFYYLALCLSPVPRPPPHNGVTPKRGFRKGSVGAGLLNRGQKIILGKPESKSQDTTKFLSLSPVPTQTFLALLNFS